MKEIPILLPIFDRGIYELSFRRVSNLKLNRYSVRYAILSQMFNLRSDESALNDSLV